MNETHHQPLHREALRREALQAEALQGDALQGETFRREEPSVRPTGESDVTVRRDEDAPHEDVSPVHALVIRVRDTCWGPVERAWHARETTTVVRLSDDASSKVDTLIAAGMFDTRRATAAFLIEEGIHAQDSLFEEIEQKMSDIESLRSELRSMHDGHG